MASTQKKRTQIPTKKDEGYGWVVVFAAFFIQAIQDGVRFSYGLFFVEFLNEFGKGKGQTAWIGSITLGVFNLGGPISAYIVNRFGYRFGALLGSCISTVAFLLSYFAPNIYYIYITYGALQGFGFGMVHLSGYVATGKYFYKRRALAVGITFCGGGIGTFVLVPLTRLMIDTYTWRGAMLILAGIALNGCVFSVMLRPFVEDDTKTDETGMDKSEINRNTSKVLGIRKDASGDTQSKEEETQRIPLLSWRTDNDVDKDLSVTKTNKFLTSSKSVPDMRSQRTFCNKESIKCFSNRSLNMPLVVADTIDKYCASFSVTQWTKNSETDSKDSKECTSSDQDHILTENGHDKFRNSVLESVFPKELATNVSFIIIMVSTVFIAIPEFVPYSMLPDFGLNVGCSWSQSAWFLSAIGFGATISQVGAGWLADMTCVHTLALLGASILSIGVTTMIIAVIPMFETLIIYSILYGILSGAMYSVQPIVLLEYIGDEQMASVYGLTMWVYGASGFIGTPLAGWLFDATGSYTASFLSAGACFLLSGTINFLVLCTKRGRESSRQKNQRGLTSE